MNGMGERLRKIRRKRGLDITMLADKVGVSVSTIQKIETSERGKTFEKLPSIAKALDCRIDDLFPEMDIPEAPEANKPANAGEFEDESLDDLEI